MFCSEVEGGLSSEQANKRLRLFVPAAAELSRQREATQLGPKHQLSMVRAALRLGRQVPAPCPLPLALPGTSALCCCLAPAHSQIPSLSLDAFCLIQTQSQVSNVSLFVGCCDSNLMVRYDTTSEATADDGKGLASCQRITS